MFVTALAQYAFVYNDMTDLETQAQHDVQVEMIAVWSEKLLDIHKLLTKHATLHSQLVCYRSW